MPLWQWVVDSLGVLLLLALLLGGALVVRRRWLARRSGTFELSHRGDQAGASDGWVLGVGRYAGDRLEFFRVFSLSPRPKHVLQRRDLVYTGTRRPRGVETRDLYAAHLVVCCDTGDGEVELAMAPDTLTGFLAWLEAAPPGHRPQPR